MRSELLGAKSYGSDKFEYLNYYDQMFESLIYKDISLLEIGVYKGGSLLLWKDYFPNGKITGIDIKLPDQFPPTDHILLFQGSQDDPTFLTYVAKKVAPQGFDIIIDDASHYGELTKRAFWHLFNNHLKPGGIYAIEDWGTGYWNNWPDGSALNLSKQESSFGSVSKKPFPCHSYGMVGFIKQLIDEQAALDVTKYDDVQRVSKFESIWITPFIVFVKKHA